MDSHSDDEDIVFGGSELHKHLIDAGFGHLGDVYEKVPDQKTTVDFSFRQRVAESAKHVSSKLWKSLKRKLGIAAMEENQNDQYFIMAVLNVIRNSSLITNEDLVFLQNMLESCLPQVMIDIPRASHYFSPWMAGGLGLGIALTFTPDIPLAVQVPAVSFLVSGLATNLVRYHHFKGRRNFEKTCTALKETLDNIGKLRTLLGRGLQFVQEMELISRGFMLPLLGNHLVTRQASTGSEILLCHPLRHELNAAASQLIALSRSQTLKLQEVLPLGHTIDNPVHYLACSEEIQDEILPDSFITVQHLRNSIKKCSLLLSELLRRLALCFLAEDKTVLPRLIQDFNKHFNSQIAETTSRLQTSYNYYVSWNSPNEESGEGSVNFAPNTKHNMETTLTSLERHLRASALIIENVKNRLREGEELRESLERLTSECSCIVACNDMILNEFSKTSRVSDPVSLQALSSESLLQSLNVPTVDKQSVPLFGKWDPETQDEILEAEIYGSEQQPEIYDDYDDSLFYLSREERLRRKREKAAQSKLLYSELQHVLQAKAAEWRTREEKALARKGIYQLPEMESSLPDNSTNENPEECGFESGKLDDFPVETSLPKFSFDDLPAANPNLSLQASLTAQIRSIALQRPMQNEELLGSSDED